MSHADYIRSQAIACLDEQFYALIMAAMRQADTDNLEKLQNAFPTVRAELLARYNAPGGFLPGENPEVDKLQEAIDKRD